MIGALEELTGATELFGASELLAGATLLTASLLLEVSVTGPTQAANPEMASARPAMRAAWGVTRRVCGNCIGMPLSLLTVIF